MRALKWMVIVALVAAGCGDKTTINNYYSLTNGVITGRVTPADPGTKVMTADSVKVRYADANGLFVLDSLPTGFYHIVIVPVHFSRREFTEVTVTAGQVASLGDVKLSAYPYPFFQSAPADSQDSVGIRASISLYADEPVVLDDLSRLAVITPSLNGDWHEQIRRSKYPGAAVYSFYSAEGMEIATSYRVTIPASVHTTKRTPLGSDLSFGFTTEPLRVQVASFQKGIDDGVSLLNFSPTIRFNAFVEADSLTKAVSFSPHIGGIWVQYGGSSGSMLYTLFATSGVPLQPQTDYRMIIRSDVALTNGLGLPKPDTTRFTTEPYGVIQSYPQNGSRMHCTLCGINLVFNAPMDSASVREAFGLRDAASDTLVPGAFTLTYDLYEMQFVPYGALRPGTVYRYTLSRTARTLTGQTLAQDLAVTFLVESSPWTVEQESSTPDESVWQ